MKKELLLFIIFGLQIFINACKKNEAVDKPRSHVIANAGNPDSVTISFLPGNCSPSNNAFNLDGSKSTSNNGNIVSYYWTYLQSYPKNTGGPVTIESQGEARTAVLVNTPGDYWFSLRVFDDQEGINSDTVHITVKADTTNGIKTQLANVTKVADIKSMIPISILAIDRKAVIQYANSDAPSINLFTIYDLDSKSWTDIPVGTARGGAVMANVGNKLLLSGGRTTDGGYYDKIDILDITNGNWTHLNLPTNFEIFKCAVAGNKIFFTGKDLSQVYVQESDRVEILDLVTNTWTSTKMSQQRKASTKIIAAGDNVYFLSNPNYYDNVVVDVYHISANKWSTLDFEDTYASTRGFAMADNVYFYGSNSYPDNGVVESWNPGTGGTDAICMGQNYVTAYPLDNQLLIFRLVSDGWEYYKSELYKYDPATHKWILGLLSQDVLIGGVGAVFTQGGQARILAVGPSRYPDGLVDYNNDNPPPDCTFWEIDF